MYPTTPRAVTARIRAFCSRLHAGGEPVYVPVTPVPGATLKDCFHSVHRHVRCHGGTALFGWQITEWPCAFLEAEFHAVWQDPHGNLRDITPRQFPLSRSLFLTDSTRRYEGRQIENVIEPLIDSPAVLAYVKACAAHHEFMNREARGNLHGVITLHGADAAEYRGIEARLYAALSQLPQPGRNDPCPCGCGRKAKSCHTVPYIDGAPHPGYGAGLRRERASVRSAC